MILNRADLRKIIYDFNSISNRLMQANFDDYVGVVSKFLSFIKSSPVIYDYIKDCGECTQNMDEEFNEIRTSYECCIFDLGETTEEEVRNVFAILEYIAEKEIRVHISVADGYTSSTKYQDRIKAFNDRVVMVLIRHIESYLTKIGIDMGIDEKAMYSITVNNGQVNIASDNASIVATNNVGVDLSQLDALIQAVREEASGVSEEDKETLNDNLEIIDEQLKSSQPRKGFIKTALAGIKAIKGTVEFATAVAALIQFVQSLIC